MNRTSMIVIIGALALMAVACGQQASPRPVPTGWVSAEECVQTLAKAIGGTRFNTTERIVRQVCGDELEIQTHPKHIQDAIRTLLRTEVEISIQNLEYQMYLRR